jgi:hypothetical protein
MLQVNNYLGAARVMVVMGENFHCAINDVHS